MNRWFKLAFFVSLIFTLVIGCIPSYGSNKEQREKTAKIAKENNLPIVIALVETSASPNLFKKGAILAIDEINQSGGVLTGRLFEYLERDDQGKASIGQQIAREISQYLDVVAVIGHRYSSVAIPVSITYEKNGIVFISTGSTDPMLTAHENFYVFRNIPTDEIIGRELAKFANQQDFEKMFIIFERESYGKRLAEFFREEAETKQGITISATRSYHKKEDNFRSLLVGAEELDFDAILVAGGVNQATELIRQTRMMGIMQPFMGGDSLDSQKLIGIGYDAMGTFVASVFNPNFNKQSKQFVERFKESTRKEFKEKHKIETCKYDKECKEVDKAAKCKNGYCEIEPDAKAAQGYDAVKVLARAIENSKSTVPMDIAMALRYMEGWKGVVGSYEFLANGNISGRGIHVKRLAAGDKFKFLK